MTKHNPQFIHPNVFSLTFPHHDEPLINIIKVSLGANYPRAHQLFTQHDATTCRTQFNGRASTLCNFGSLIKTAHPIRSFQTIQALPVSSPAAGEQYHRPHNQQWAMRNGLHRSHIHSRWAGRIEQFVWQYDNNHMLAEGIYLMRNNWSERMVVLVVVLLLLGTLKGHVGYSLTHSPSARQAEEQSTEISRFQLWPSCRYLCHTLVTA